uniref:Uncharacterized protein n=1 Tax=Anguilla anguilla TaxID=7936 RepID=A0A0E9UNF8_ANGAN
MTVNRYIYTYIVLCKGLGHPTYNIIYSIYLVLDVSFLFSASVCQ